MEEENNILVIQVKIVGIILIVNVNGKTMNVKQLQVIRFLIQMVVLGEKVFIMVLIKIQR